MRRTQLYLPEDLTVRLKRISRKEHKTVSELARVALEEKYLGGRRLPPAEALKACRGIWQDRRRFDTERFIRGIRQDRRQARPR